MILYVVVIIAIPLVYGNALFPAYRRCLMVQFDSRCLMVQFDGSCILSSVMIHIHTICALYAQVNIQWYTVRRLLWRVAIVNTRKQNNNRNKIVNNEITFHLLVGQKSERPAPELLMHLFTYSGHYYFGFQFGWTKYSLATNTNERK